MRDDSADLTFEASNERYSAFGVTCPICAAVPRESCTKPPGVDDRRCWVHMARSRAAFRARVVEIAAGGATADDVEQALGQAAFFNLGAVRSYCRREGIPLAKKPRHTWAPCPEGDPGWSRAMKRCGRCGLLVERHDRWTHYYRAIERGRGKTRRTELVPVTGAYAPPCREAP